MNYTQEDVIDLATCGWMEDRSSALSMCAVMHVVMNRVISPNFPDTVREVIHQHNQFSYTMPGNPEYGRDPATSTGRDHEMWEAALTHHTSRSEDPYGEA